MTIPIRGAAGSGSRERPRPRLARSPVVFFVTLVLVIAWAARPVEAQPQADGLGVGLQLGEPSGVTLQWHNPRSLSWDFLAAWDFDDFLFLNVHGLYYSGLGRDNVVHVFYGPGVFIGIEDGGNDGDDETVVGISAALGIGFMLEQIQLFASITPRLSVAPDTEGRVGAGIGARYYF